MSAALPEPYGGTLVNPLLDPDRAAALLDTAARGVSWDLTATQLADLELLLTGALSPLRGYMTRADADSCREDARLSDGTMWPVPLTLAVSPAVAGALAAHDPLVLRDLEGAPLALVWADDVWEAPTEAAGGGGTAWRVSGRVDGLRLPVHHDSPANRLTPAAARAGLEARRWPHTVAVPVAGALSPALVAATLDEAARLDAGLLVLLLVRPAGPAGADRSTLVRAALDGFSAYPRERALLALLPWHPAQTLERDRLARAIVARNFGCSHIVLRPDAALPGLDEIGILPIGLEAASDEDDQRALLLDPPARRGFTVFLTGLSGSGKSTVANMLRSRLQARGGRRVSLLDGDLVRKHLSSELGFSRAHRDINVRRIAYVASEITKHGGAAICAPIAPYEAGRREARRMIEEVGDFLLVFVDTPLEVCEARDPKGLYARARAGLLPAFTGISDPYERPEQPDIVLDTTAVSAEQAADRIMAVLEARGYFT